MPSEIPLPTLVDTTKVAQALSAVERLCPNSTKEGIGVMIAVLGALAASEAEDADEIAEQVRVAVRNFAALADMLEPMEAANG